MNVDFKFNIYFVLMFLTCIIAIPQPKYYNYFGAVISWLAFFGFAKIIAQYYHYGVYESDDDKY